MEEIADQEQKKFYEQKIAKVLNKENTTTLPDKLERIDQKIPNLKRWVKYE